MYEGIGLSIHEVQIAGDWASIESVKPYAKANIAKKRELLQRKVVRLTRTAPGPFKTEMTLSEHFAADEEAQAEARGDELIALWAWLKRIEAMKVQVEVGE